MRAVPRADVRRATPFAAPADLRAALEAASRAACGPVAPARGLYLVRVDYAPDVAAPPAP